MGKQKNYSKVSAPDRSPQDDGFEIFSCDLERFSTEDLIFFLESSFRKSEYEKVAGILSSREKSLKTEIGKNCARLEEQLTRIKEDLGVIDDLLAELEKKEKKRREEFVELKAANRDLECAKRRAEDERDEWKKKFGDLQVRALRLVEENAGIIEGRKADVLDDGKRQYKENCLCTSSSKRKHASEMVAGSRKSKNDNEDDDDNDGKVPIGKLIQGKESRGTEMTEFLLDGIPRGPLKKSAEELGKHDLQGLNYCCKLGTDFSKQMCEIYNSKEDPYCLSD